VNSIIATVPVIVAVLASAIGVIGGLAALARAIWKAAQDIRDNRIATVRNTTAFIDLSQKMDGRITALEGRMLTMEARMTPGTPPQPQKAPRPGPGPPRRQRPLARPVRVRRR
jgi:hypothetical protein